jgi:hypothetical protein
LGRPTSLPAGAGDDGVVVYLQGPFDVTAGAVDVVGLLLPDGDAADVEP